MAYKDNAKDRDQDVMKKKAMPGGICYTHPLPLPDSTVLFTFPRTWADFQAQRPERWWQWLQEQLTKAVDLSQYHCFQPQSSGWPQRGVLCPTEQQHP